MRRHHGSDPDLHATYTRRRLLVLGAAAAVPLTAWGVSGRFRLTPAGVGPRADTSSTMPPATAGTATEPVAPSSSTTTVPAFDHALRLGMSEAKVEALQTRLIELRLDPGPVDGVFGESTLRAVWAFEKLMLGVAPAELSGVVDAGMWARMNEPLVVLPRRTPGGTHVEVYLPEQVAALFRDGQVELVTHVSTGEGVEWCDEVTVDNDDGTTTTTGICGLAVTPGGVYHVERRIDGWRNAKLGRLYNPVYFNYGIAIHGATNVPAWPASRGCVRIPMHIAEYFPDRVSIGDAVYVFDGVDEPEHYGAQPMVFDWPDPDSTTTSTTASPSTAAGAASTTAAPAA